MHVFHIAFGSVIQVPVKAPSLCRRGRYWLWWRRTKEMAGHVSVGTMVTRATYRHLMSPFLLTSEDGGEKGKIHFLKLCSSSIGTDQPEARWVGPLVIPEGDPKTKVLSLLMREVLQKNGVLYGAVPRI